MINIVDNLEKRFLNKIIPVFNKVTRSRILKTGLKLSAASRSKLVKENLKYENCEYLTKKNYNKSIEINEINQYTALNIPIDSSKSLHKMAKECLKNILKSKKILVNNKSINFEDCVILDLVDISNVATFSAFHTDTEYSRFIGNAFNVWYLIENNENYGNIFLLESDEYKKKYTPCFLDNHYKDNLIPVNQNSYLNFLTFPFFLKNLGYLNKDNVKVTYANIKNGECIVMSKHVLHRGDELRKDNVKGFHFRVIVKNKDGSINYNGFYKQSDKFPNHRWDEQNQKLYGVEVFDFA